MAHPKLNRELIEKASDLIRKGNYAQVAARCCGVSEAAWYSWLAQAEDIRESGKAPQTEREVLLVDLLESIEKANADAEATLIEEVLKHKNRTYKASLEVLHRRFPERWANTAARPIKSTDETPKLIKSLFAKFKESFNRLRGKHEDDKQATGSNEEDSLL